MKNTPLFTKGQRMAIISLIVMIISFVGVAIYLAQMPSSIPPYKQEAKALQQEIEKFQNTLQNKPYHTYTHKSKESLQNTSAPEQYTLSKFNPNEADSASLRSLGLSQYVTRNILRYRAKGGRFKKIDDLRKIYGMTDEKMKELRPYIVLANDTLASKPLKQYVLHKKDTVIELNTADTTSLQYIKGIGPAYARRIIYYRQRLGGYHHIEQLLETIQLSDEDFAYAMQHFTIDTTLIQTIPVNSASVERLKKHPYINFYIAKSIYDTRRNAFELTNINELKGKANLPDTTLRKLSPYLSFEKRKKKYINHNK